MAVNLGPQIIRAFFRCPFVLCVRSVSETRKTSTEKSRCELTKWFFRHCTLIFRIRCSVSQRKRKLRRKTSVAVGWEFVFSHPRSYRRPNISKFKWLDDRQCTVIVGRNIFYRYFIVYRIKLKVFRYFAGAPQKACTHPTFVISLVGERKTLPSNWNENRKWILAAGFYRRGAKLFPTASQTIEKCCARRVFIVGTQANLILGRKRFIVEF